MNRRTFSLACLGAMATAAATVGAGVLPAAAAKDTPSTGPGREPGKRHIAFVLFDGMTALDLIGPAAVLTASGQFDVDYVWRDTKPVTAESKAGRQLALVPTATFAEIQATDILCVPGPATPTPRSGSRIWWSGWPGSEARRRG